MSVHLTGKNGVPSRTFTRDQLLKVIHVQACIRRFLCKKLVKNLAINPGLYHRTPSSVQSHLSNSRKKQTRSYTSKIVNRKLVELGPYKWPTKPADSDNIELEERKEQLLFPTMVKYTGQWRVDIGVRHGKGTLIWPDGTRYDGYFVNGQQEGLGRIIHSDGDVYQGNWANSMSNGKGKYTHRDGATYDGEWLNDLHHGWGREVWTDGAIFEGYYAHGKKQGKGRFVWPDGSKFEGEFHENKMEGQGVYQWADGRKYDGQWK